MTWRVGVENHFREEFNAKRFRVNRLDDALGRFDEAIAVGAERRVPKGGVKPLQSRIKAAVTGGAPAGTRDDKGHKGHFSRIRHLPRFPTPAKMG